MARRVQSATGAGPTSAPGAQGTMGGIRQAVGSRPGGRSVPLGDEVYLWILVLAEVGVISWLRATFSRYHGG